MNSERTLLSRQLTVLVIMTIIGSAVRLLPYWKEEYDGWLFCIWGVNAVLPLFMVGVSKCSSLFWAYIIPLLGFIASDLIIQWILTAKNLPTSSLTGRLTLYALFLVLAQLGLVLRFLKLSRLTSIMTGVGLTLLGSCLFFLISNFMVWLGSTPNAGKFYYPPTLAGLIDCYVNAWPFFQNQFVGDAIFSAVFFTVYALLEQRYFITSKSAVATA